MTTYDNYNGLLLDLLKLYTMIFLIINQKEIKWVICQRQIVTLGKFML